MIKNRKNYLILILVIALLITVIGISYAAFNYVGTGQKLNTITTGAITMNYIESSNVISMNNALPTTDATGKKRKNTGEYFDFTVKSSIKGNTDINYEIAAKEESGNTFSGKNIKFYLTKVNSDGTEEEVMPPKTYSEDTTSNIYTGRPADMMSLFVGNLNQQGDTEIKYRLRLWVDENYNPQNDNGGLIYKVKVNVYGQTSDTVAEVEDTYCKDNGFDTLSDCMLVMNNHESNVETAKQNIYVKERDKIGNKVTIEAQGANELKAGTSLPIVLENEGKTQLIVSTENEAGLVTKREYTAIIDKQIKRPGSLTLKLNDANGNEYKSNTWTNQNVYMEVAQGGQNIVTTFKVDGTVAIEERSEPLTITQEGLYTITVINRDDVGNESQSSLRVKIDKTAPVAPVLQIVKGEKDNEDNEWYKGDVNLKIIESTEDEGGSGVSHATYEVSGTANVPETRTNGQEMSIVNEGIYTITIYEYDVAGNKSEGATQVIKIDKTTPQNIKLVASQITGKTFHIQASSEENLSGTAKYQLYIDGKLYKELNSSENTADFDVIEQSSKTHQVSIIIYDVAGNANIETIQVNMGRLNTSEIDHIEFEINSFTRTNNGSTVANGADFLISDTSLSDASKFIQVNSATTNVKGTITGNIKLVRKDGEVVNVLEYFPQGLQIEVSQYSNGSGTVWQHNANINMLNTTNSNQGKEEGQSYSSTVDVSNKQNNDNKFEISDEKQKGTKTYTRFI